jgi:hypothetical protein
MLEIVFCEVERIVSAKLERRKAGHTNLTCPILRFNTREGIEGDLFPAPEFTVKLEEVAVSNAQGRLWLRWCLFLNVSALEFTADDVVTAEELIVLVDVDTTRIASRNGVAGSAVNVAGVEGDNRVRVVTDFFNNVDRVSITP